MHFRTGRLQAAAEVTGRGQVSKIGSGKHVRGKHSHVEDSAVRGAHAAGMKEDSPFINGWDNSIEVPRRKRSRKRIAFAGIAVVVAVAALVGLGAFHPDIRSRITNTIATFGLDTSATTAQAQADSAKQAKDSSHKQDEDEALARESSSEPATPPLDLATADFSTIPGDATLTGFTINPAARAPEIGLDARVAIDGATGAITQENECSFVFLDLTSGKGYCQNADQEFYTASSFKAPYAFYLLQRSENGEELSESDRENIHAAITWSDNDSYDSLHYKYDDQEFYDWLASHGITQDPAYGWYPNTSAKKMASLWSEMFQYVMSGSENAQWLLETTSSTSTSFIRTGLEDSGASVWNKGGWISDSDVSAVCDAGIVRSSDGRDYLMVIMTDQDDGGTSYERVSALAQALYDARDGLA